MRRRHPAHLPGPHVQGAGEITLRILPRSEHMLLLSAEVPVIPDLWIQVDVGLIGVQRDLALRQLSDQPVDSVWAAVRDFESLPRWWGDMQRVERVTGTAGGDMWTYHMSSGPITIAVESSEPPRQLVTRIVADEDAPFGGTWTYDLVPAGDGTRVTITEDGYINSLFFRFVANVFMGVHGTADSYLESLARRFGQEIEPEHVR